MITVEFPSIWYLNKEVALYSVARPTELEGVPSLCVVIYNQLKLTNGHSFIAEIYGLCGGSDPQHSRNQDNASHNGQE